jgi:hypothetical protein
MKCHFKMSNKKYNTEEERKEAKRIKQEEYYNKNKEKIKIKDRERHLKKNKVLNEEEKEEKRIYAKSYRVLNSDKIKLYYIKNKEELRIKQRLYQNNRLKTDIQYKLKHNLRTLIRNTFKNNGYTKNSKTNDILGCSYEDFKFYLESKFEPWMNWDNRGLYNGELNYGWDIDHIIPLDSSVTEEDVIRLNHYTNLQPLCSYTNRNIKKNN